MWRRVSSLATEDDLHTEPERLVNASTFRRSRSWLALRRL